VSGAASSLPALLRAFPRLAERLPRHAALRGPTPVEPLRLAGVAEGALWVKRDDRSCPLYGGNKPRKLEFLIGHALARGARRLVTTGGLGTNHGLATTILGRDAGLATTLVLVRQPLSEGVRRTLLLQAAWGARQVYGANVPGAALATLGVLAGSALRGERPYLVPTGGSSPRGNAGLVSAALELAEQVRAGALPAPARIFVPVGTGGTLAGLVAGLRVAGLASRVVGVLVTDILPPDPRSLARLARRTLRFLHRLDPRVPVTEIAATDFDFVRDALGPGYGAATPAAERAVQVAREAGLALETTYTGKCLAALLARSEELSPAAPTLFWNTYNAVDVAAAAPAPLEPARLPPRIRRLVEPLPPRAAGW
jgi:D-cysteine desulfhydrase